MTRLMVVRSIKAATLVLTLALLAGCSSRIGPGMVGIEVDQSGTQRGVQDIVLKTGRVWYNPYSTSIIEYPTYMQSVVWTASTSEGNPADESITFTTEDSMVVSADWNVSYQLIEKQIPNFYIQFRSEDLKGFSDGFMHNQARDCINGVAGKYHVEQIMGDNADFIKASRDCLQSTLRPFGVEITQFGLIGAPRPPDAVKASINMKVQATQIALQKQNEVAQAEAEAKKMVAMADGDAAAQIAHAKGDAESNRIRAASITPQLIEWRKLDNSQSMIQKWGGEVPHTVLGSSGGVLLQMPNQ